MQSSSDPRATLKGTACVLFSILIWSGWIVASRYGVKGSLSAADITAIRFGVAGTILLPVALRRGLAIGPYGAWGGLLLALCMGAPYTNMAVAGMAFAPASHAGTLINGSLLILTTLVGIHGLKERTSALRLAGVAFSLAGIACMLMAKSSASSPEQWRGHLMFVASGLMWGVYTLLVKAWKAQPLHAAAVVCVFSLVGYLPLYLLFVHSHIGIGNIREVAFQAFYQGILTGIIAFTSFNNGIRLLGASHAGAFIPLVPVLATLFAVPLLHEMPTTLEWAGVGAVSFGVLLASGLFGKRAKSLPQVASEIE